MNLPGRCGVLVALLCSLALCFADQGPPEIARPGGAGYALVFRDNVVVKTDFKDFPKNAFTFEAWISSSDFCHAGSIFSYAVEESAKSIHEKTMNYNHFLIYDIQNIIACRGFEWINSDIHWSCQSHYNKSMFDFYPKTANLVERDAKWHHLAVTWSAEKSSERNGETIIYVDGMEVGRAQSGHTKPLSRKGSLMLGGEQDCFQGCTDPRQGFYGMMDEVRIWKTIRTQRQIIDNMRITGGHLDRDEDLVAYWKFDDPGTEGYESNGILRDSSGKANDLDMFNPPMREDVVIKHDKYPKKSLNTGALKFKNNYAMNSGMTKMPVKDISIEFWAKSSDLTNASDAATHERYAEFVSFATQSVGDGDVSNDFGLADSAFMDDAIRIERYLTEYNVSDYLIETNISTKGAISVHINANRQGSGRHQDNWLDFATEWLDDKWHHIAVTWEHYTGETRLYFDGEEVIPFWRAYEGKMDDRNPEDGGVRNILAPRVERSNYGSFVLGQNQECYGGCFSPSAAYDGYLADVRIWRRVIDQQFIQDNMFSSHPENHIDLALHYNFQNRYLEGAKERTRKVRSAVGDTTLSLGSIGPTFQYSDAPLTSFDGVPLPKPSPGKMGHALKLHDRQVLMMHNFRDFPARELTVEFWMWSIDACRPGVPFSYATGGYKDTDNSFLIFNYNNWGVSVMEDEGFIDDHNAGFGSTDGHWHHIAVTWSSDSGEVRLYDNGRPQWIVQRGRGQKIPSGGTLVIGREQDCLGGCFDSAFGAAGDVQEVSNLEYGPQDFFGIIEEMRIWKRVRTDEEVYTSMKYDTDVDRGTVNNDVNRDDSDLVAWWKFDEGKGYTVKDETGNGHTLHLMEEPDWVVPKWLGTCGDGLMEGGEECDDGNKKNGDGCDAYCKIERGWICDAVSPTMCAREGEKIPRRDDNVQTVDKRSVGSGTAGRLGDSVRTGQGAVQDRVEETPQNSNQGTRRSRHAGGSGLRGFFIVFILLAVVALLIFVVYRKREAIYEYAPWMEDFVHSSKARVMQTFGGRSGYSNPETAVDPTTDFAEAQPPSTYHIPGAYERIPDRQS